MANVELLRKLIENERVDFGVVFDYAHQIVKKVEPKADRQLDGLLLEAALVAQAAVERLIRFLQRRPMFSCCATSGARVALVYKRRPLISG